MHSRIQSPAAWVGPWKFVVCSAILRGWKVPIHGHQALAWLTRSSVTWHGNPNLDAAHLVFHAISVVPPLCGNFVVENNFSFDCLLSVNMKTLCLGSSCYRIVGLWFYICLQASGHSAHGRTGQNFSPEFYNLWRLRTRVSPPSSHDQHARQPRDPLHSRHSPCLLP